MIVIFGEGGATSMARDTAGTMLQSFEAIKEAVGWVGYTQDAEGCIDRGIGGEVSVTHSCR